MRFTTVDAEEALQISNLTWLRGTTGRTQPNLAGPLKDYSKKWFLGSDVFPEKRLNAK